MQFLTRTADILTFDTCTYIAVILIKQEHIVIIGFQNFCRKWTFTRMMFPYYMF